MFLRTSSRDFAWASDQLVARRVFHVKLLIRDSRRNFRWLGSM
jgi:hypothetical protein